MRWTISTAALLLAFAALWYVGDHHRQNCLDNRRDGCSVLPWIQGHYAPSAPGEETETQRILRCAAERESGLPSDC